MDITLAYGVSIWLRYMRPEQNIRAYLQGQIIPDNERRERFVASGLKQYPRYSENELGLLYESMQQVDGGRTAGDVMRGNGLFKHIYQLAAQALHMDGDVVRCRHEQMVDWREAVHEVGQTPFISAYLAWEDLRVGYKRGRFDWPPYARTDNLRLRQMLSRGIADNHFHLKGSAPPFMLAWMCLMNYVTRRADEFKSLKRLFFFEERQQAQQEMHGQVFQAAVIRLLLSCVLNGEYENSCFDSDHDDGEQVDALRDKCNAWLYAGFADVTPVVGDLQGYIDAERLMHHPDSLDYLHNTRLLPGDSVYKLIAGEQAFQYRMFSAIFSGDPRLILYQDLFEAYLLIYVRLRAELVQMNPNVGFFNFSNYEMRKEIFLEHYPAYEDALKQLAYNGVLQNTSIQMLEARITPKQSVRDMHLQMQRDRRLICEYQRFNCGQYDQTRGQCRHLHDNSNQEPPCLSRLCYTVHLVKDPKAAGIPEASPLSQVIAGYMHCRHQEFRENKVRTAIDNLLNWRATGAMEAGLVYAIDACNHEIGCRPEVFAPGFRRARLSSMDAQTQALQGVKMPILRVTYHVGEDFLDVTDGLRAIEETVRFLELRHGDRLGHAIALGIDAAEWYSYKHNRLFLPRQDLLDNAVWLMVRLREFGISTVGIDHELRMLFRDQFNYIYRSSIPFDEYEHSISMETYFESWLLRGDEPSVYMECGYDAKGLNSAQRREQEEEEKRQFISRLRQLQPGEFQDSTACNRIRHDNWQAVMVMHHYHYNPYVKRRGAEPVEFEVKPSYVCAVRELQRALREDIARRGIAVETNPSSNYLISTFKRYDKHPILNFYPIEPERERTTVAISASINTDDQGVFDTDIENEYALMACALENVHEEQGNLRYEPDQVYRWLERIRIMGLEQSFKTSPSRMSGV